MIHLYPHQNQQTCIYSKYQITFSSKTTAHNKFSLSAVALNQISTQRAYNTHRDIANLQMALP